MNELKNSRLLLVFILALLPFSVLIGATTGMSWVIAMYPLLAILGTLIGFILAPILLWVYKKVIGRNSLFAIQERSPPENGYGMLMGLFPVLMATNFTLSLLFDPIIMSFPLFQDYYLDVSSIILLFFILGSFLQAPAFALFTAAWIIKDSGIVSTDKKNVEQMQGPVGLESIGGWFLAFLKGYAGIGVIISLYQFNFEFGFTVHWSAVFILSILPILISLWVIPVIIIVSATYEKRRSFILNFAKRFGIKNEFESSITITDDSSTLKQADGTWEDV